ncbi:unnamed protein product, partial [marine sediment metagenome]
GLPAGRSKLEEGDELDEDELAGRKDEIGRLEVDEG